MTYYESIVEALRVCVKHGLSQEALENAGAAADAIEELMKPRWIPVTERLPDTDDDVLVTDGDDYYVAYWRKDSGPWDSYQCGWVDANITHWMPIPKPPEVGV